jgi:transcriptional regulator with XRE-family HTH domain
MRPHLVSLEHPGLHLLEVGIQIKTWRLRRRITQQQLAALANISSVALSSLVNGRRAGNVLTYMATAQGRSMLTSATSSPKAAKSVLVQAHPDVLWNAAPMAVADWPVPTEQQLTDCRRLAASRAANSPYDAGVSSTLRWIGGVGNSPLTSQPPPASRVAAEQEFHVAADVELEDSPLSAVIPAATAQGVRRTLAWLLGLDHHPPIELPRRPVPAARQLYDEALAADPWRYDLPEARAAAQLAAVREAARLAEMAARADELPD